MRSKLLEVFRIRRSSTPRVYTRILNHFVKELQVPLQVRIDQFLRAKIRRYKNMRRRPGAAKIHQLPASVVVFSDISDVHEHAAQRREVLLHLWNHFHREGG